MHAQGLTQSADAKSTIYFKGTNINIDLGKADLSFGLNNLDATIGDPSKIFWGFGVKAKDEEGIGNLFSNGELVPFGAFNCYFGWSYSNTVIPHYNEIEAQLLEQRTQIKNEKYKLLLNKTEINIENISNDDSMLYNLKHSLLKILNSENFNESEFFDTLKLRDDKNDSFNSHVDSAKRKIRNSYDSLNISLKTIYQPKIKEIDSKRKIYKDAYKDIPYFQLLFFGFGEINAMNFKHFTSFDSLNLNNSFNSEYFRGGKIGLGINMQYGNFLFGLTYDYIKTNNFNLLTKKDFTLRQTFNSGNLTLINEKKIEAYSGDYGDVEINDLNFDFIWNLKLDEKATNHILINPYIRSQLFSRNESLLPNKMDIGCGFYFFQQTGKFLGGLYIELPDVFNDYEKVKPITEQDLREPFKRLTFGIVGKYSFNSLLNSF
jgi:hypothetical protein